MHTLLARFHPILVGIALGLSTVTAHAQDQLPREYVIQAGDTCLDIVNRFPGLTLKELHRLNPQLGELPHDLAAGARLVINEKSAPDAVLTFIKPRVELREPNGADWRPGLTGEELYRKYRVATREQATAEVTFTDHARFQVRENSHFTVYGDPAKLSKTSKDKSGSELAEGSLRGGLKASGKGAIPATIFTPDAEVTVLSRDVLLVVDKDKNTRIAVYEGRAQITAQGVTIEVPEGAGTVAMFGKPPEPARPLPASPLRVDPPLITRLTYGDVLSRFDLSWKPVGDAVKYHVEAATDPKFNELYLDRTVAAGVSSFTIENLRPGRHYLRVSSIDASGLQAYGTTAVVAVARVRLEGAQRRGDGTFWAPRQVVLKTEPWVMPIEVSVDGRATDPARLEFRGSGKHRVVVRASEPGYVAEIIELELSDVNVNASVSPRDVGSAGGQVRVDVKLTNGQKKPIKLEGAYVQIEGGYQQPVEQLADGTMSAIVTIPPAQTRRVVPLQVFLAAETSPRTALEVIQQGP